MPQFHKDLWKVSIEGGDIVIVCPRGFSKTTAISKILALWLLLFELEQSIIIISSKGLGENIIGDIRRELEENAMITNLWGQLVPIDTKQSDESKKWRQNELQLLSGVEVKTLTKGQAVRGQRPTLVILDDPEENKDVKNPVIAEEFFNWVFTSLYGALDDGGRMIVLGTIISASCFVNRLKSQALARSFMVFEFPAILGFDWKIWGETKDWKKATAEAKSLWPQRWTLEKLKEKYEKLTEKPFMQEFMNIPYVVNGTPVFLQPKLTVVEPVEIKGNWKIYKQLTETYVDAEGKTQIKKLYNGFVGIDVANGSQSGDYSVIKIRDEQMNLLAQYRGKVAQDILASELHAMIDYFNDVFIVPENNIALAFLNECKSYDWFTKIYRKTTFDTVLQKETEIIGWNTNVKTKILFITEYGKVLREGLEVSEETHEEILHYYYDEKGGMNAISPYHDDTIIADALSIQAIKCGLRAPLLSFF